MTTPRASNADPRSAEHPAPHHHASTARWDLVKTAVVGVGVLLIVLAAATTSGWMSMEGTDLSVRVLTFGVTALVAVVCAHAASVAYLSGRWGVAGAWAAATVAVVAGVIIGLNAVADSLPQVLSVPVPRGVLAVAGALVSIAGLTRNSDTIHERHREATDDDWFVRTGRVLRAGHMWTDEQADEQMRRARAEFEHAQSRRAQGSEPLTPRDLFGSPEQYASSRTERPPASPDPALAGRWYYLLTALVLGVWAALRTYSTGVSWLSLLLFLFAVVAMGMFVWASLKVRRR